MRNLEYSYNVSLDGFIEGPGGNFEWSTPDEELHRYYNELEETVDTHLYGRVMFELMAEFWPTADQDMSQPDYVREYASLWRRAKKVVVSRTRDHIDGVRLIKDNLAEEVRALKQEDGKDISVGGSILAQSLMQLDLIDEFRCFVCPIVLTSGKPMFQRLDAPLRLQLVEVRHFNSGVVLLHYRRHGDHG